MKRRVDKLEKIKKLSEYAAVVIIDEGQPLPDNIGPGTVVIVDNIPRAKLGRAAAKKSD